MKRFFTILYLSFAFVMASQAQKDMVILLVADNDAAAEITDSLRHAIKNVGYSYVDYDVNANGIPSVDALKTYELVIWATGKDFSNNLKEAQDTLKEYLDNGGMFWVEGIDFMYDIAGRAPDTFQTGDFVYDYLGIETYVAQAHYDDGAYSDGVPMLTVVADNGICSVDTLTWRWSTMWGADAFEPVSTAKSIYVMGPEGYDFAGKSTIVYNEKGDAKILSAAIRWDGFKTVEMRDTLTAQILDYFNQFSTASKVAVSSIEITGGDEITENNGSLQLSATVLPENATIKTVTWSIGEGSVAASITQDGLLTASGLDSENGKVYVIATANDGSGVADTAEITISNQTLGEGYKILLVNDNANGTERYLDIDTALNALDAATYKYKIFNTITEKTAPSAKYLSNFDFVIWYTGNDGVNLYFWDVTDSSDIKCNAALKEYADNGGVVWVQGLDFLYDVFGKNYTDANANGDSIIAGFASGDFAYDYLGIKSYVAQSKSNDGGTGVPQLDLDTEHNDITTLNPIKWAYSTLWYADALEATNNAKPLYYMGPNTYDFSLYYAMLYNKNEKAQFVTSTFETARLDTQDNINELIKEVVEYFKDHPITSVKDIANSNISLNIYPNPTRQLVEISFTTKKVETVDVRISDLSGKIVRKKIVVAGGNQTLNFDISSLPEGVYNVNVASSDFNVNRRLVVVK